MFLFVLVLYILNCVSFSFHFFCQWSLDENAVFRNWHCLYLLVLWTQLLLYWHTQEAE